MWAADEAHLQHRELIARLTPRRRSRQTRWRWLSSAGIHPDQVTSRSESAPSDSWSALAPLRRIACPETSIETVVAAETLAACSWTSEHRRHDRGRYRGHGHVAALLLGSVSGALVRHSEHPVVVVRPRQTAGRGVLIGADGSAESVELVELAYREASLRELPLTVVHCLWDGHGGAGPLGRRRGHRPPGEEARLRMAESVAGWARSSPTSRWRSSHSRGHRRLPVDLSTHHELLVIGRPPRASAPVVSRSAA